MENNHKIPSKERSKSKDVLWFNIEYCPIKGENRRKKIEYFVRNLLNPTLLILIITILIIIFGIIALFKVEIKENYWIFGAFLTLFLLILWENYQEARKKINYFRGFMIEIRNNIELLNANIETTCFENKKIYDKIDSDEGMHPNMFELEPLFSLQFEFWELLKANIPLNDLKMDIEELEGFFYDAGRFNEVIPYRNNVKSSKDYEDPLEARFTYNSSLITLGKYAMDHLLKALKSRGQIFRLKKEDLKKCKDACYFINYLEESKNIKLNSENKDKVKKSYNKIPDEIIIYHYYEY